MPKNKAPIIIAFVVLIAIIIPFQIGCAAKTPVPTPNKIRSEEPTIKTVHIAAVGDFLMHMPVVNSAYDNSTASHDFAKMFLEVKPHFSAADLTIANLETTLAGDHKGFTGYPRFNSPSRLATDMRDIGIDIVTTANNHCLDYGEEGLLNTIEHLNDANLKHLGTYKNSTEQETPFIIDINGIKIGLICYTEMTNGIPVPSNKEYLVNIINLNQIKREITALKEEDVDLVIACIHFGEEYRREPNAYQKEVVDKLFALGTDVILGNHAHVIQPMEKRTFENTENTGFVIYSLGNFISNQRWRYSDSGLILNLFFEKNLETNVTVLTEVDYVPTWVHTYTANSGIHYRVLPVHEAIYNYEQGLDPHITPADYTRLCEVWSETTSHVDVPEMNILPVTRLYN